MSETEKCKFCNHDLSLHDKLKAVKRLDCNDESSSGQFMCGCQGDGKIIKSKCNVCDRDCGNSYCLDRHLRENISCLEGFVPQFY